MKVEDEAVRKGFMVHDVLDCPEQNPFYSQQCTRQQEMRRGYEAASQGSAQICMNSALSHPIFSPALNKILIKCSTGQNFQKQKLKRKYVRQWNKKNELSLRA